MDTLTINLSLDQEENIILAFNTDEKIKIITTGDIDLSEYVKKLTFLINKNIKISLNKFKVEDSKLNLIQKTIEDITTSFNESIKDECDQVDEEIPF